MSKAVAIAFAITATGLSYRVDALPAFPGAEGFGASATGGRGGQVIKVTTLAADGPGSLQAALDVAGPRIIVFAVSGVIEGDINVTHGDVTIAGQTAPGAGITIHGRLTGEYDDSVTNIIVRHLRVRPVYGGGAGEQFDALQFSLNSKVILDHMSVSWGVDETMDLYEADDITVQWSTIEDSATSGHPEGMHNYGLINGPDGHRISLHHNLFIHHKNRCPAIANGPADVINNVAYNVRHGFVHHNPASGPFNIIGNVYIQGPDDSLIPFFFDDENDFSAGDLSYYLADNYIDDPGDYVGVVDDPWITPYQHPSFEDMLAPASLHTTVKHVFSGDYTPVTVHPSSDVEEIVAHGAGAFPRDVVTTQMLSELASKTGSWGVDTPGDLLEGLTPASPPPDADNDGMDDAWETDHGLDPSNGSDHATVMESGYTAIEEYINSEANEVAPPTPPGGESSSSSSAASGGGETSSASGGAADPSAPPAASDEGCAVGSPASRGHVALLLGFIGIALALRRRK